MSPFRPLILPPTLSRRLAPIAPCLQLLKARSNRATKRINATDRQRSSENKRTALRTGPTQKRTQEDENERGKRRMMMPKAQEVEDRAEEGERERVYSRLCLVNGLNGRSRGHSQFKSPPILCSPIRFSEIVSKPPTFASVFTFSGLYSSICTCPHPPPLPPPASLQPRVRLSPLVYRNNSNSEFLRRWLL